MYSIKRGNRYLLFTILSYVMGSLFLSILFMLSDKEPGIIAQVILSQYGMVLIPILIYFIVTKAPLQETLLIRKIKPLNILLCIVLAFSISPTLSLLNVLSQFFVENNVADMVLELASAPYAVALFLVALTPAVLEEIAMRSIIINNYRSKPVLTTCLASGFFFGMFHMNLNQFFYAFAMGVVMCLAVHLTGSVLASMTIHFMINASSVTLAKAYYWLQDFLSISNPEMARQMTMTTVDDASLLASTLVLLAINFVSIPVTGLVLWGLASYNGQKNIFRDKLTSAQVLGLADKEGAASDYDFTREFLTPAEQRILTPGLIGAIGLFSLFVITFEIVIPLMS